MTKPTGPNWDEKFAGDEHFYGTVPNAFLAERARATFPPGARVASLGEGEGRNAVWLAEQGFDVTAVEPSTVGLTKLHRLATARGVHVHAVQARAQDFTAEVPFDGVVLVYLHAPPGEREAIHQRARDLLRPGGVVLLEAFSPEQRLLGRTSGGPRDVDLLFTEERLRADFAGFDLEHLEACEVVLDEGPGHRGPANVVRLIARKP